VAERDDDGRLTTSKDPHRDLAGALHDVSNALTVLLGWVAEARAPELPPDAVAYALRIIEQRARIARDLARHAIGAPRIDEQASIGSITTEVVEALRVEATRSGVTTEIRGAGGAAMVAGALDLSQILTNLLLNALAYAPSGTTIALDLSSDEDTCWILVSDEGPGVPASRRDGIFRGDSLRPGGTGVGLRHSRDLARASGGDLDLVQSASGKGATFRVAWPRADAMPRPPMSTPRVRELAGVRVLVIEDDDAVTQLLEAALEARGAEVTIVGTPRALSEALARATFDAALIDLSPIAEDVTGALAELRQRSPGVDVVLITGSADRLPAAVTAEGIKLVRKPFELPEVFAALARRPR
jgi:CheY-like chemotaxis protein